MQLTIVGCAGSAPSGDSACSCYLVESDGYRLLLDVGSGAAGPLQRRVRPCDVDAVIVSHPHGDHWADLAALGYLRDRAGSGPLRVIGAATLPAMVWNEPETFDATAARAGTVTLGPVRARLARVEHRALECWATRVGDALCYTADTAPCDSLDELAAGCRVLLAEASGLDADRPLNGHLSAGDAARLACRSGARLLILTHLRGWQDHAALLTEAAAIADCPVILAHPGLRVAL